MPTQEWIGLPLAFASALLTNTAYSLEHDAAAALPPLSPRRPFRSVKFLLHDRRWLTAFGIESAGWLMYVAALRLAPPPPRPGGTPPPGGRPPVRDRARRPLPASRASQFSPGP